MFRWNECQLQLDVSRYFETDISGFSITDKLILASLIIKNSDKSYNEVNFLLISV